jgi:hypothetical protein
VGNALKPRSGSEHIVKGRQSLRHEIYSIEPKIDID